MGKFMVKAVSPLAKQKLKAPPKIKPSESTLDALIVARFVDQQREVAELLKQLAAVEADRIVMTSPLLSVVTYSLLDAARLTIAHERRHLAQAQRVLESAGFPQ
ncbi:MAG: DinB family protein [Acidobacteria bacterium]|nr:DinB family protein [Acidobacteriota bacterium]